MEWISNMKVFRSSLEKLLFIVGLLLLSFYVAARIHGFVSSRAELSRFWQARETASRAETASASLLQGGANPDFQLWSAKRIAAYKQSLSSAAPLPLAVLSIPAVNLEVPVLEGTNEFTLNRAVGHIEDTPEPGQNGNVGIAGHRDGFFRRLKDLQQGDAIELITQKERARYVVDEILVVSPEDVSVLRSRSKTSLTLVTCYPFYYVGSAPQRYIVHASIANPVDRPRARQQSSSAVRGGGQEEH
jgi:sortase A